MKIYTQGDEDLETPITHNNQMSMGGENLPFSRTLEESGNLAQAPKSPNTTETLGSRLMLLGIL